MDCDFLKYLLVLILISIVGLFLYQAYYGPTIIKTGGKKLFGCGFTVRSNNSLPSVYYTHLKNTTVRKGSKVEVGQLLGYVMDFPGSPFDHLHIGIETGDISQFVTKDGTIKNI